LRLCDYGMAFCASGCGHHSGNLQCMRWRLLYEIKSRNLVQQARKPLWRRSHIQPGQTIYINSYCRRERYMTTYFPLSPSCLPFYCQTLENRSSLFELKPLAGFGGACIVVVATGEAWPHSPKSSSPLTCGVALLWPNPPLDEPHPMSLEAVAVAVLVDVVGCVSFQALVEPQPSKFDDRLMLGDLAVVCAGAAG
jgi:hypothetical protein